MCLIDDGMFLTYQHSNMQKESNVNLLIRINVTNKSFAYN
jgi:hypothetical protein